MVVVYMDEARHGQLSRWLMVESSLGGLFAQKVARYCIYLEFSAADYGTFSPWKRAKR